MKEMVFQQKLLEKSIFHCQNDWSGYGPADQFWLLESALKDIFTDLELCCYLLYLQSIINDNCLTFYWLLINFIIYFLYYVSFLFFGFALSNPLVREVIAWKFGQGQGQ